MLNILCCFTQEPSDRKTVAIVAMIVAAISIGVAMAAGSRSSTELKSELLMCSAFVSCSTVSFKKQTIEGQKTQSLLLLQPYYRFYAQLKVAKVRPKQAQLVCAAHGTREPGTRLRWGSKTQALQPLHQCYRFDAQLKVTKLPSA